MIAIKYASNELREDIEFITELMQYNCLVSADMRSNNIIQNIIAVAVNSCELASIFAL
jgi:hypothetical protein